MNPTLYFLRSSEQKITSDMLHFAYRLDELGKTISDFKELDIYHKSYGLTSKDIGLYALVNNEIAGALWLRELNQNTKIPCLTIAVKPSFRNKGIGTAILEQFFLEIGAVYEQITITILNTQKTTNYFEKFKFIKQENSITKSLVDNSEVITMIKKIENKLVERPSDGYDPRKWMD